MYTAVTQKELAAKIGVDSLNLVGVVEEFNQALECEFENLFGLMTQNSMKKKLK